MTTPQETISADNEVIRDTLRDESSSMQARISNSSPRSSDFSCSTVTMTRVSLPTLEGTQLSSETVVVSSMSRTSTSQPLSIAISPSSESKRSSRCSVSAELSPLPRFRAKKGSVPVKEDGISQIAKSNVLPRLRTQINSPNKSKPSITNLTQACSYIPTIASSKQQTKSEVSRNNVDSKDGLASCSPSQCCIKVDRQSWLGAGSFGRVYKGKYSDAQLQQISVGVKILSAKAVTKDLKKEVQLAKSMRHPNIVETIGMFETSRRFLIVMELVPEGCLEGLLERLSLRRRSLGSFRSIVYASDIASALEYVHKRGILHKDLRPANVLVSKKGCKLINFGICKHIRAVAVKDAKDQMPDYTAPEVFETFDEKCDIYSLGLILKEMLLGWHQHNWTKDVMQQIPRSLKKVVDWFSHPKATKRPNAEEAGSALRKEFSRMQKRRSTEGTNSKSRQSITHVSPQLSPRYISPQLSPRQVSPQPSPRRRNRL